MNAHSPAAPFYPINARPIFYSHPLLQSGRQVTDPAQLEQMFTEGREAAEFLKTSIVQAVKNERGHFGEFNQL